MTTHTVQIAPEGTRYAGTYEIAGTEPGKGFPLFILAKDDDEEGPCERLARTFDEALEGLQRARARGYLERSEAHYEGPRMYAVTFYRDVNPGDVFVFAEAP